MTQVNHKPIPAVVELTRPFWEGAHSGKLMMQKCSACGTMNFLPKPWCVDCGSRKLSWVEVRPTGKIYSYTIAYTVMMNYPGWAEDIPVIEGIIDLDDGGRLYAQIIDEDPSNARIGARVLAHFVKITENIGIPKFRIMKDEA